ncbi:hypothetical protein D3C87_954090 [compost metagenome]
MILEVQGHSEVISGFKEIRRQLACLAELRQRRIQHRHGATAEEQAHFEMSMRPGERRVRSRHELRKEFVDGIALAHLAAQGLALIGHVTAPQ